jgi:hypothetical protein
VKYREIKIGDVQPKDIIKFHIFGRKFRVGHKQAGNKMHQVDLLLHSLDGSKTYRGFFRTLWTTMGGTWFKWVWCKRDSWIDYDNKDFEFEEDKLYLVAK